MRTISIVLFAFGVVFSVVGLLMLSKEASFADTALALLVACAFGQLSAAANMLHSCDCYDDEERD